MAKRILKNNREYYATTTVNSDLAPAYGCGVWISDGDNNIFLDFTSGVGVNNLGYSHPEIIQAISKHLSETGIVNFIHHDWPNSGTVKLAQKLSYKLEKYFATQHQEQRSYKMFFANSGAEINEAALKLVWAHRPERQKILYFNDAFHGRTLGIMSCLTKEAHIKNYPKYLRQIFTGLPFPKDEETFEMMKRRLTSPGFNLRNYGALFMEIIQGEGGLNILYPPAAKWIQKEIIEKHNIYLILDEVQTGNGRTGKYWVFEHYPCLKPTIITTAKGIASGMPFAAMWFPSEMDWRELGRHSSTYGGNALGAAAAMATFDVLESGLISNARKMEKVMAKELAKLEKDFSCVKNARGIGLMWGIDIVKCPSLWGKDIGEPWLELRDMIEKEVLRWGLIIMRCGESSLRIMPPLIITEKELQEGFQRLCKAIQYCLDNIVGQQGGW